MPQKDAIAKAFFGRREVIADIVNALLGRGVMIVRPCDVRILTQEHIRPVKDRSGRTVYETRISDIRAELHGRDIGGRPYWMRLCMECQSTVARRMPVRCAGYVSRDMEAQDEEIPLVGGRRLLFPTLSIVANVSGKPWRAPQSLGELYAFRPDFLNGYMMENRTLTIDPLNFPEECVEFLLSDLKYVVNCPKSDGDADALFSYLRSLPADMPEVTAHFICMLKEIPIPEDFRERKEGETFMCYATRIMCERKVQEGVQIGLQQGRQQGIQEKAADVFRELVKMKLPKESIQAALKLSPAEYQRLLNL